MIFLKLFLALAVLFAYYTQTVFASTAGDELRRVKNALVVVRTQCEYDIYTRKLGGVPLMRMLFYAGNGFFVQDESEPHKNITAGHVVQCPKTLSETFFDENLKKEDVVSFDVKEKFWVRFHDEDYVANVRKILNGFPDMPDMALLDVLLPKNLLHYHIPILPESIVYDILDEMVIFGDMPLNQKFGWIPRLKKAGIEYIGKNFLQLNAFAYPGMSGSPVLYWVNGIYYAAGILVAGVEGVDVSWTTRLNTGFVQDK